MPLSAAWRCSEELFRHIWHPQSKQGVLREAKTAPRETKRYMALAGPNRQAKASLTILCDQVQLARQNKQVSRTGGSC